MKRFWMSWYQPGDDRRPVYDPKVESEPLDHRYWKSGERGSDGAATVCAVVDAENEKSAKAAVNRYWPEAAEWRFIEEKTLDFMPGDRFPMKAAKS